MGIFRNMDENFLGGKFPGEFTRGLLDWWQFSGWEFSGWEFSWYCFENALVVKVPKLNYLKKYGLVKGKVDLYTISIFLKLWAFIFGIFITPISTWLISQVLWKRYHLFRKNLRLLTKIYYVAYCNNNLPIKIFEKWIYPKRQSSIFNCCFFVNGQLMWLWFVIMK